MMHASGPSAARLGPGKNADPVVTGSECRCGTIESAAWLSESSPQAVRLPGRLPTWRNIAEPALPSFDGEDERALPLPRRSRVADRGAGWTHQRSASRHRPVRLRRDSVGSVFGFTLDYLPLLVEAAHADWHYRHENVAQTLGAVGTEAALPALAVLVSARPSYADKIDDSVALARHALHGIERIGGAKARDLITDALGDEREPVRANAQRMLNRW